MQHIVNTTIFNNNPSISVYDRGFTLGHGIFETILVVNGKIPLLEYHWSRANESAKKLYIDINISYEDFKYQINRLIKVNNLMNDIASIRVTITHGEAARGIFPTSPTEPNIIYTASKIAAPTNSALTAVVVKTKRNENSISSQVKSISYLDNILAKKEAIDAGYDEAILLNSKGLVSEGSITNIFIIKNNKIYTPPLKSGALPGITRKVLLEHNPNITEKDISLKFLLDADSIFLTNSLMGIKPVSKINELKKEIDPIIEDFYIQFFKNIF